MMIRGYKDRIDISEFMSLDPLDIVSILKSILNRYIFFIKIQKLYRIYLTL